MNKKKYEYFLIPIVIIILLAEVFVIYKEYTESSLQIDEKYKEYTENSLYFENRYKKEPTTSNLLELCNYYSKNNDMKYLQYIDTLLSAEDYEETLEKIYGDEQSIIEKKKVQIVSTMYICAANNDIDSFVDAIEKYYLKIPGDRPELFYQAMANLNTSFCMKNKDIIISTLYTVIQEEPPLIKLRELVSIKAYYTVVDNGNPQLEVISDEIDALFSELSYIENIQDSFEIISKTYEQYWFELIV